MGSKKEGQKQEQAPNYLLLRESMCFDLLNPAHIYGMNRKEIFMKYSVLMENCS